MSRSLFDRHLTDTTLTTAHVHTTHAHTTHVLVAHNTRASRTQHTCKSHSPGCGQTKHSAVSFCQHLAVQLDQSGVYRLQPEQPTRSSLDPAFGSQLGAGLQTDTHCYEALLAICQRRGHLPFKHSLLILCDLRPKSRVFVFACLRE